MSGSRGTHKPDPATTRLTGWIGPVVDGRRLRPGGVGRHPGRTAQRRPRRRRPRPGRHPRRHRRGEQGGVGSARRPRRRHGPALRAGGDQPRRRPAAERAPALAAQPRPAGHGRRRPRRRRRRGHRAAPPSTTPGSTLAVEAKGKPGAKKRPPTSLPVSWAHLGPGRVQVEFGRAEADTPEDEAPTRHARRRRGASRTTARTGEEGGQ